MAVDAAAALPPAADEEATGAALPEAAPFMHDVDEPA